MSSLDRFTHLKQGAGSGYVILSGKDRELNTQSINLTGEASIFQAELIAIQEAAKHLYTHEDTHQADTIS